MNNDNLIQDFLSRYKNSDEHNNLSYKNNCLYSYNTCIAEFKQNKKGDFVLLTSLNCFSSTTAKHLCKLRNNNNHCEEILLNQSLNSQYFNLIEIITKTSKSLDDLNLKLKAQREVFRTLYSNTFKLINLNLNHNEKAALKEFMKKHNSTYQLLKSPQKTQLLIKNLREKEKNKNASFRRIKAALIKTNKILSRKACKEWLKALQGKDYQLIFKTGDGNYITTRGYGISGGEVRRFLVDYLAHISTPYYHPIIQTRKGQCFTLSKVTKQYMQVGCHKIPMFVVKALIKDLNIVKETT